MADESQVDKMVFFELNGRGLSADSGLIFALTASCKLKIFDTRSEADDAIARCGDVFSEPKSQIDALYEIQNEPLYLGPPVTRFFSAHTGVKVIELAVYSRTGRAPLKLTYDVVIESGGPVLYTASSLDHSTGIARKLEEAERERLDLKLPKASRHHLLTPRSGSQGS